MSSVLMKQCIRQDKTVFDEKQLDAIDPRYRQQLRTLLSGWLAPRLRIIEQYNQSRGLTPEAMAKNFGIIPEEYGLAIESSLDLAQEIGFEKGMLPTRANKAAVIRQISHWNNLATPPSQLTDAEIREDIVRALGHVKLRVTGQHVVLSDRFDFAGKDQTTPQLLWGAAKDSVWYGNNVEALTKIGRVFCKEENGKPTDSSIPVRIVLKVKEQDIEPSAPPPDIVANNSQQMVDKIKKGFTP